MRQATESDPSLRLVRDIVGALDELAGVEAIWRRGVVHRGGPHYRLRGMLGPVSLGEDECLVFGQLIAALRPANCFIIGNAFGMSSVFIAKSMEAHGGRAVITLDSLSEGDGQRCHAVAEALRTRLNARLLTNKAGWSPQDIPQAAEDDHYDLLFIDGDHSHPQVTLDFHGVQPLAHENTVICWHDYWMAGIPESVAVAEAQGYHCLKVKTSCEMVFGVKNPALFARLRALYPNSEPPRPRRRPLAYLKLYQALLIGGMKTYALRQHGRP